MKTKGMMRLIMGVVLCFSLAGAAWAGNPVTVDASKLRPHINSKVIQNGPLKRCADLKAWNNYKLTPQDEFPFESGCKSCWLKVGVMNMVNMSIWIENVGILSAPPSMAKLTWANGKPPYSTRSIEVSVPALKPGEKKLLTIHVPNNEFFQIAKPIKLELDSHHTIKECNEANNIYTYHY